MNTCSGSSRWLGRATSPLPSAGRARSGGTPPPCPRFGAVLVRMGRATLELAVAAPPWERSECLAIAAEHYAFCDDTYRGNPGTLRDYANLLRGATRWSFWWD